MWTIVAQNVHTALPMGLQLVQRQAKLRESRNGPAYVVNAPVTTTYLNPMQRVLFYPERDANHFFHLLEALWMLRGRNDTQFVGGIVKRMYEYSDDGLVLHGAYGKRWRDWFPARMREAEGGLDQLDIIVKRLRENPDDRRCVLQMWDADQDLDRPRKDVPCNTVAYVSINNDGALDITISNRSNDMIWGAYGANAVHFSVLLEYLARRVGRPLGRYFQISNNFHAYVDVYAKIESMADYPDPYQTGEVEAYPLMDAGKEDLFDADLKAFFDAVDIEDAGGAVDWAQITWHNSFFPRVAVPLWCAHQVMKTEKSAARFTKARRILDDLAASDWKKATLEWIDRREKLFFRKQERKLAAAVSEIGGPPAEVAEAKTQAAL